MLAKKTLIKFLVMLVAMLLVLLTCLQLFQQKYDTHPVNNHMVVDIPDDQINNYLLNRNDRRNIESVTQNEELQIRINKLEKYLVNMDTRLSKIELNINASSVISSSSKINSNSNQNELKDILNIDKLEWLPDPNEIIYENPLNNPQCQNAILELENVNDINKLIDKHARKIHCTKHQKWKPAVWTREGLGALLQHRCYRPHTPLRTSTYYMDVIADGKSFNAKENNMDHPVYYHMPKCASSSIAAMTEEHFNWKAKWIDGPETNHDIVYTRCGFTFIRNPIIRFISGYYTVNNMLYRDCKDNNGRKTFLNHTNEKYQDIKFIRVIGEPQRFEAYLDEMFDDPYLFGKRLPFRHTGSQMYFLSNWYGSDIHFFGRVEQFEKHWNELIELEQCKWFKEYTNDTVDVVNSMYHYGFYGITLYRKSNGEKKEYVDALGMRENLEKMYGRRNGRVDADDILAPMYYLMTEKLFNKIRKYFWQDFVCFGYTGLDWNWFQNYVAQYPIE